MAPFNPIHLRPFCTNNVYSSAYPNKSAAEEAGNLFNIFFGDILKKFGSPTYHFNVGDAVTYIDACCERGTTTIKAVYGDGLAYLVKVTEADPGYHYKEDTFLYLLPWFLVRPQTFLKGDTHFAAERYWGYSTYTVDNLFHCYYNHITTVISSPHSDNCTPQEREALLSKIFANEAISPITMLYVSTNYTSIISEDPCFDTLMMFFENRIPYRGKYFNQLSHSDYHAFMGYKIPIKNSIQISHDDDGKRKLRIVTEENPTALRSFGSHYKQSVSESTF